MLKYTIEADGAYLDEEGITWKDKESFIVGRLFGFCGCGLPEEVISYIWGALKLFDLQTNMVKFEEVDGYFANKGAKYFMWYWLDQKGYTEHGGSVPGWLTEGGKELLLFIESHLTEERGHTK